MPRDTKRTTAQGNVIVMGENDLANCRPTEVTQTYWIHASRKSGSYPKATERSGKWLLFVKVEQVDETWAAIKRATEEGKLGFWSKVATMRPNPNSGDRRTKVICVYTYDSDDTADVLRVRQALRELGITEKLPYKTDQATMEGLRISKFYL